MRKLLKAATLGWITAIGLTAPAQSETLADALVSAYNNSGLLDQNRALLRAADEDVAIAISSLRPILNWSADITREFGRADSGPATVGIRQTDVNAGITASLLLYDFGRTQFQIDAAKETVLATRNSLVSIEQDVLLRAVQAYMNVRRNSRFVSLRENNLRLIRQELRAAEDRFEVGEVTRTDVALAEALKALVLVNIYVFAPLRRIGSAAEIVIGIKRGNLATDLARCGTTVFWITKFGNSDHGNEYRRALPIGIPDIPNFIRVVCHGLIGG